MGPAAQGSIEDGDHAWRQRAETIEGELARPVRIEASLHSYRAALAQQPTSLRAAWKVLRSLHYAIDFTTLPSARKAELVTEALGLAAPERRNKLTGSSEDRARYLFWSAIALGSRAQTAELLTTVVEGLATRMHEAAERSITLDPSVDQGGAFRLLSRLHAVLPRVPFVTGWVDRGQALKLAELAYALDPTHPGNQLILGLALLESEPSRGDEGIAFITGVATAEPRPSHLVEDLAIRAQAQRRLEDL